MIEQVAKILADAGADPVAAARAAAVLDAGGTVAEARAAMERVAPELIFDPADDLVLALSSVARAYLVAGA